MKTAKQNIIEYLIILVILIPVLFFNTGSSHDWGGDFAMYLQQCYNLLHGIPQLENNYIFNPSYNMLGPPLYPAGFPILLSPIYAVFGDNMGVLVGYMSIILILWGLGLFTFFRIHFNFLISLVLVLMVVYQPWVLSFKREVMADIPFALFFILAIWHYTHRKNPWITGLLIAMAIMTKSVGWVLIVALAMDLGFKTLQWILSRKSTKAISFIKQPLIAMITAGLIATGINNLLLAIPSDIGLYQKNFATEGFVQEMVNGGDYYFIILKDYFLTDTPILQGLAGIVTWIILIAGITGLIVRLIRKPEFIEWIFLVFVGILFIYPNRLGGVRFMLPIFPLLLFYALIGLNFIFSFLKNYKIIPATMVALAIFSLFAQKDFRIITQKEHTLDGPQEKYAAEAFLKIQELTDPDDVILFIKPRVLGYYAQRKSFSNQIWDPLKKVEYDVNHLGADYLLTSINPQNPVLEELIGLRKPLWIWSNARFSLFKWSTEQQK